MANNIYINTQLKDLTANAVANLNRPTQVVRLPQIIEGEVADVVLHLVNSNGQYDARSGTAVDVAVAISAKGKAATSGTFKLNAGIDSTGALAWNASAEAVAGALNALNGGSGAYGSKVSVEKLANGSYRVIFDDVGARVDMAGQSLDLAPESTVAVSTSVVGSPVIRAQQVIEISQQPAIFSETWASVGSTWTGQLDANTARVQEMIADGADAFFEVKVGTDVVCQVPISILPSVAAPNSFPAHTLPDNLDAFAANPTTNGFFNPANWREDLSLVVGEDVQAWSTNLDEVAAKMEWNNQELTFDIITGSGGVVIQVGQETVMYCRNKTGADILDGQVVKIVGAQGDIPNIELAIASNAEEAHRTIGVATQTISANSGKGFITLVGKVRGLDLRLLNGFTEGGLVYLSDTTPGALTPIKPAIEVEIGHALRLGQNNGTLGVFINNEASVYELKQELLQQVPHNSNSVIICNDGDNIQDKYDEAAALAAGGATNRADLIVMSGYYPSGLSVDGNINYPVSIIGVGDRNSIVIDGIQVYENHGLITNISSYSFTTLENYGTIKDVNAALVDITDNYGTVDNVNATNRWSASSNSNAGIIKNCSGDLFIKYLLNDGIIDNCHSTGTTSRAFGGLIGSFNYGTIKNCTAKGDLSFGQQTAGGVTENCVGAFRAFAGASNNIDFFAGLGIQGTYKNCTGGNESFFGRNTKTDAAVEMEATYENCTGGDKSFGFVESAPASGNVAPKTVFAGTAKNCTAGSNSFASSFDVGAQAEIKAGAVIENCTAKNKSFATHIDPLITTCKNYGNVIRSRCTGASGFSATGTGKVRLCLNQDFDEINLP